MHESSCIIHHSYFVFFSDFQGKLTPYNPGPFDVLKLGPKDEDALSQDKAVMKQIPGEGGKGNEGGRAICIQDVNAPKEAVWNQILDLDHYVGKVNKLKECKNYVVKKNKDGTSTIKTKMVVGVIPGYSVSFAMHEGILLGCEPFFVQSCRLLTHPLYPITIVCPLV
jgi:hypothetical protein